MNPRNRDDRRGFTLIEVLLVLGILVLLGSISVVVYTNVKSKANERAAQVLVDQVTTQIQQYYNDMDQYPEGEGSEALKLLVEKPEDEELAEKWNGPYLEEVPEDPWGRELQYELVETEDDTVVVPYRVWSQGPKEDVEDDDIRSWEEDDDGM